MTGQTNVERRTFPQSIAAGSDAALASLLSHRATAQPDKATSAASGRFEIGCDVGTRQDRDKVDHVHREKEVPPELADVQRRADD